MKAARPVPLPWMRLLAGLLTVLAAFAFQARGGQGVAPLFVGQAQHGAPAAQTTHRGHHPGDEAPRRPPVPHAHGAHCLFCLTQAYGLEASVPELVTGSPRSPPPPGVFTLPVSRALPRHADARAPPPRPS
ncbi:hypothetical protein DAERI_020253 [Deinococcus aerius]|uniref:DUF2946 domain-containing protein n=2 Tax=Deinococcus TaxID=1298 RepID=A0A2I9D2F5_9DEIO|nr:MULTISPECIES: DUF2946 family protein [Deinococcus]MBB5293883.1 hypothetical protein [Deinococcus metallilatus]QBY07171.1 hypothetical protein E5F05_04095 [Deinococcus metallilatus]RXJ14643.1 hypothetical protein ERJ73_02825 [Deinococcus metallilatus]TLK30763.1 hypothetical protein FCS05_03140 [Deinococcus metallilatus]GBF04656.1 hypothetical protein DAERI_020253 [Deinococcus aerius]